MCTFLKTKILAIGPDVMDLADGGVLILFAEGAPPELAEVSVLHRVESCDASADLSAGASLSIGSLRAAITAVGPAAWAKVADIGHVVFTFNGAGTADRPGEICAEAISPEDLRAAIGVGNDIVITG